MSSFQLFLAGFLLMSSIGFLLMLRITIAEIINPIVINTDGKYIVYIANIFVVLWIACLICFIYSIT